jgi:hypothetical protein
MLVACRLAGLSALEGHYARVRVGAQCGPTQRSRKKPMRQRRTVGLSNVQSFGAERLSMQAGRSGKRAQISRFRVAKAWPEIAIRPAWSIAKILATHPDRAVAQAWLISSRFAADCRQIEIRNSWPSAPLKYNPMCDLDHSQGHEICGT